MDVLERDVTEAGELSQMGRSRVSESPYNTNKARKVLFLFRRLYLPPPPCHEVSFLAVLWTQA